MVLTNSFTSWQQISIGDLLEVIIDYRGKTPPKSSYGIPTITAANVKNGHIDLSRVSYVSQEIYNKWITRGLPKPGDVIITTEAPVGEVALLPSDQTYLITRRVMALRGKKDILDNKFLKYSLLCPSNLNRLLQSTRGTTVPRVLKTNITTFKIAIPPFSEQKAIAHILGTLDNKIELNQRMNRTLEAIAQAIFKSWFIDFDPVRAKMEGRQPEGMSKEVADLFPDSFVDSELGMIPKGWSITKLEDLINIKHGYAFKGDFFKTDPPGDILLTPGNFAIGGGFKDDKFKYYFGIAPKEFILSKGDLLVTMTDLSKAADTLGYPALLPSEREGRYLHNQRLGKIIIKSNTLVGKLFLYYLLKTDNYRHEILASAINSTVKHTSPKQILAFQFPLSNNQLALKFETFISPLYQTFCSNNQQNYIIAAIRDTLLPKLISGEIRVKEAEKILEEVV
ncbi:MAG: restriction endonuclease subunit S [Gomphosphaeria aponina SAG 52.96 = DSM 107014]|uniref:Restriction endonuclease subunit S n=1 Tax=Gomphosphaeria aponina SAG 52.96 = DSM 107014 TaxID=1521640 RepID=A0A941GSK9_9CHRO|nr:restriction endonuclease subunit S [Gomphosphaeria aponina SAG 52.96 = DSM 107014]